MAAMDDPFFVVKEEVQRALNHVNELHTRWRALLSDDPLEQDYEDATSEIKNKLRSIEWDLEDLDETISIVESNPLKFKLNPSDIVERRDFIQITKNKVRSIKTEVFSPDSVQKTKPTAKNTNYGNKYARLEDNLDKVNQRYIDDHQSQQQLLMGRQDEQLHQVESSVSVLKSMGHQIGDELDEQGVLIDELNLEVEQTDSKLNTVLLRVEKVLRLAGDKKQTYILIALVLIMIIVVILFVTL